MRKIKVIYDLFEFMSVIKRPASAVNSKQTICAPLDFNKIHIFTCTFFIVSLSSWTLKVESLNRKGLPTLMFRASRLIYYCNWRYYNAIQFHRIHKKVRVIMCHYKNYFFPMAKQTKRTNNIILQEFLFFE